MREETIAHWCERVLGSLPVETLFQIGHLSSVTGYRLADGRRIVVKIRPTTPRISTCFALQRHIWEQGFPCPEPLAPPTSVDGEIITAEDFVETGEYIEGTVSTAMKF